MPPLVVAHRTCPNHAAENSLAGIAVAAVLGADYVEVDVRRTLDGVPVLVHDAVPVRTLWPPLPLPVRWLPATIVRRPRLRHGHGERMPTLAAALAALPDGLGMAIDTKDPGAAPATLAAVRDAGAEARVMLWSQHEPAVRYYAANVADGVTVALLRDAFRPADVDRLLADATAFGATAVSVPDVTATPAFVARAADQGIGVFQWCRTFAAQSTAAGAAVHGVVTDWVAEARAQLT